jgi:hypothetical protein
MIASDPSGTAVALPECRGKTTMTNRNRSNETRHANNIVWMRRQPLTTSRKEDRLELLVVRAGLRAGRRAWRKRQ